MIKMWGALLKLHTNLELNSEDGQDLIEYALVVALIAFAAIAGMNSVASGINAAFTNVATTLNSSLT